MGHLSVGEQGRAFDEAETLPAFATGTDSSSSEAVDRRNQTKKNKTGKNHAATGASAGTMRAITGQLVAFYFRTPIKAFFRTRVDYLAFARAVNPRVQANKSWSWHMSTPGILAHAVRLYGWGFIPHNVIPPLLANVTVSTILYTTYLQTLSLLHEPSSHGSRRVYPPPAVLETFAAGCLAGGVQSFVAAPLDALQLRFSTSDMLTGRYKDVWQYSWYKLHEIGLRGIFAGWSLNLVKDAFGYGLFFATFETIKSQAFYSFASKYNDLGASQGNASASDGRLSGDVISRPHYALEPAFILIAGISASFFQQIIQYPISVFQIEHYRQLEGIDRVAATSHFSSLTLVSPPPARIFRLYCRAYKRTFAECARLIHKEGSNWIRWLFRGFWGASLRQVPSTSAGLIAFELIRRKYASSNNTFLSDSEGSSRDSGPVRVKMGNVTLSLE